MNFVKRDLAGFAAASVRRRAGALIVGEA